jgi:hypothetical protein
MAPTPLTVTALDQHCDASRAVLLAVHRELAHWALQGAIARLRAEYSDAVRMYVDVSDRPAYPAMIMTIESLEGKQLYCWFGYGTEPSPIDELLDIVVDGWAHVDPPGWRPMNVSRSRYDVTLAAVPTAVLVDLGERDDLGYYPAPSGLPGVVAAALDMLLPPVAHAAREDARGLVEGRYHPLDDIQEWASLLEGLGHRFRQPTMCRSTRTAPTRPMTPRSTRGTGRPASGSYTDWSPVCSTAWAPTPRWASTHR